MKEQLQSRERQRFTKQLLDNSIWNVAVRAWLKNLWSQREYLPLFQAEFGLAFALFPEESCLGMTCNDEQYPQIKYSHNTAAQCVWGCRV